MGESVALAVLYFGAVLTILWLFWVTLRTMQHGDQITALRRRLDNQSIAIDAVQQRVAALESTANRMGASGGASYIPPPGSF